MKKFLLFLLFLFPFSAFAGTDTDRLCADDTKWGSLPGESISVYYPGEDVRVGGIHKATVNAMYHTSALYYVLTVSVQNKPQRYEVYRYDCESKKPTLLAKVPVKEFLGDAQIAYISPTEILIIQYSDEEGGEPGSMIAIDLTTKKRIFTLTNINSYFRTGGEVLGFAQGSDGWYFIYYEAYFDGYTAYKVDKKTKKLKKL